MLFRNYLCILVKVRSINNYIAYAVTCATLPFTIIISSWIKCITNKVF